MAERPAGAPAPKWPNLAAIQKLDRLRRLAGHCKIIRDLDGSIFLGASV